MTIISSKLPTEKGYLEMEFTSWTCTITIRVMEWIRRPAFAHVEWSKCKWESLHYSLISTLSPRQV